MKTSFCTKDLQGKRPTVISVPRYMITSYFSISRFGLFSSVRSDLTIDEPYLCHITSSAVHFLKTNTGLDNKDCHAPGKTA